MIGGEDIILKSVILALCKCCAKAEIIFMLSNKHNTSNVVEILFIKPFLHRRGLKIFGF
jgi:hypothetical protein